MRFTAYISGFASLLIASSCLAQQCVTEPVQSLSPPVPTELDSFGVAVDAANEWLFISKANFTDVIGEVFVYRWNQGEWTHTQTLTSPDGLENDSFGWNLSVDGETAAIIAHPLDSSSVVHIFELEGGQWEHTKTFESRSDQQGACFCYLDIHADTLVVSVPSGRDGIVYVYTRQDGVWSETQVIEHNGSFPFRNAYGRSITIYGGRLAVGAPNSELSGFAPPGYVVTYRLDGGEWVFDSVLQVDTDKQDSGTAFGKTVAMYGEFLLVGEPASRDIGLVHGSVHVYKYTDQDESSLSTSGWERVDELYPVEPSEGRRFGSEIAIDNDSLAISSLSEYAGHPDDVFLARSTVSLYTRQSESWFFRDSIEQWGSQETDWFGYSTAIASDSLIAGIPYTGNLLTFSGSVEIYDISCLHVICVGDLNLDGQLNFYDVSAFLSAYLAQEEIADLYQDGDLNFLDVSVLLSAFASGC